MKNKRVTESLLETAISIAERGDDDDQAERVFRKALDFARIEDKKMGALECRVLLGLLDFYDKRERVEESKLVWQRVSEIVRNRYSDIVGRKGLSGKADG
ncbi:hypothetical protein [Mesotoga prima]|uniref:hypothetical protein n=1 Tax=Mesotoga prima TaxID=1184387 RepID=UPI002FDA6DC2